MDIIQITMSFFERIKARFKTIADLLASNYLPVVAEEKKSGKFFWVFDW